MNKKYEDEKKPREGFACNPSIKKLNKLNRTDPNDCKANAMISIHTANGVTAPNADDDGETYDGNPIIILATTLSEVYVAALVPLPFAK